MLNDCIYLMDYNRDYNLDGILESAVNCRDNFFRSANCGIGIAEPAPIKSIHIRCEGNYCIDILSSNGDSAAFRIWGSIPMRRQGAIS